MVAFSFIMLRGGSLQGIVAGHIRKVAQQLCTESDDVLVEKVKKGFEDAKAKEKEGIRAGFWEKVYAGTAFYEGQAAMDILAERHGYDHVLGILGYRQPQTRWEKVVYFFTGELPEQ